MRTLDRLEKSRDFWVLLVILFAFFLLRLPSLFEPHWYGDEGIYQTIGTAIRKGALLYRDTWDNKPPLLYLVYAIFNGNQFFVRSASLVVGILSTIIFYLLSKKLFENSRLIPFLTTSFFSVMLGLPLIEGNIANAENFMMLPILISALLIFSYSLSPNRSFLIFSGLLLSLAFLFKIVAVFDMASFSLFVFFVLYKDIKRMALTLKSILPLLFWFSLPIIAVSIFFLFRNAFFYFYQATFTQMVGYVGYGNQFLIPQGLLYAKLILLSFLAVFLFRSRKKIEKNYIFILLWLAFSLFNALFAQRPYTHYLLVLLPSFSLFLGTVFDNKFKKINIFIFIIILFIVIKNFNLYTKTRYYYQNFLAFAVNKKDVSSYYAFFDRNTPTDYQIAQFINMKANPKDSIFIWGNNAQVYKLTNKLPPGRFTVLYHMTSNSKTLEETRRDLNKAKPAYIIVTNTINQLPYDLSLYTPRIAIASTIIYEKTFK